MITINANNNYKECKNNFINLTAKLDSLSPLKTLTRGYVIAQKEDKVVKSAKQLEKNDNIELIFLDGKKQAQIM